MAEPNPFDVIDPTASPSGRPTKDIVWDRKGGGDFPYEQRVELAGQAAGVTTPDWFELLGQMLPETALNPNGGQRKRFGNLKSIDLWRLESRVDPVNGSTKQIKIPLTMEKIFQKDARGLNFLRDQNGMPIPNAGFENFAEQFQQTINDEQANLAKSPVDPTYGVTIAGATGGESEWESGSVVDRYVSNKMGLARVIKTLTPPDDPNQYKFTDTGKIQGNIHLTDPLVLQILNDELPVGNLLPELMERGRELGRLPFYVAQMYNSSSNYVERYTLNQLPWFGKWKRGGQPNDIWHEEERYQNSQWVAGEIKRNNEEWGNSWVSRETFLNDFVHKRIKDRIKNLFTDENGEYDEEGAVKYYQDNYMSIGRRKKGTKFIPEELILKGSKVAKKLKDQPTDESGLTLVPTMLFTPSDAEAILNYAFTELPLHNKFGVIAVENIALAKGMGMVSKARSASAYNLLYGELKYDKNGKVIQGYRHMLGGKKTPDNPKGYKWPKGKYTDKYVHQAELLDYYDGMIGKSLVNLRFFPGKVLGSPGTARMGTIDAEIKNRLNNVHSEIAHINRKLSDAKNGVIRLTSKEIEGLHKTKDNLLTEATSLSFGRPESWLTIPSLSKIPRSVVMQETYKGEMVITAGQALGAEWLPHFFPQLSPQAGEMAGGLATLLKLHRIATFVPRKIGGVIDHYTYNTVSRIPEDFARMIEEMKWVPLISPGLIVNRNLDELSEEVLSKRGSRLSNRERESLKLLVGLTDHLSPDEKENVFKSMAEIQQLREKIVSYWPEQERDFVSSMFSSTFAQMSTLAPLQAMEGIGASLRFRDLASFNFRSMDSILRQSESSYQQAMKGVAQIKQMARQGSIPSDKLIELDQILDTQQTRLGEYEKQLQSRAADYGKAIKIYKNFVTGEGGVIDGYELTEDVLDDLYDLEGTLRRFITPDDPRRFSDVAAQYPDQSELAQMTAAKEDLDAFVLDMYEGLYESLDVIGDSVTDPLLKLKRGQVWERIYNVEMWYKQKQVKEIWKPVDNALKNQRQDIAPFVEEFLREVSEHSNAPIHQMFSPQGRFFQGYLGKRMQSSFKRTIGKVIKDIKDEDGEPIFTAENIKILQQLAMKDLDINTPPDITQLFFMLKNGEFKGVTKDNPNLADISDTLAMKVDYSDLMDLHKTISNFGYSMSQKTDSIALQQAGFAKKLGDSLLNILDNPTGFDQNAVVEGSNMTAKEIIQAAKSKTQAVYYDVTDRPESISKNIMKNQKRRRMPATNKEVTIQKMPTLYSYSTKTNPLYFVDKFADSFVEFINKGTLDKGNDITREFIDLQSFFGQQVNGEIVFDLRNPINHMKFKIFQRAIEQAMYEKWDGLRINALSELPAKDDWSLKQDLATGPFGGVIDKLKPLNQTTIKRMEELQNKVFDKVKVIHADSADGKAQPIPIVNLAGMIQNDRRLERILASSPKGRKQARDIEADFKVMEGTLQSKLKARLASDQGHTRLLLQAFGSGKRGENALSVTQNILKMSPEQLRALKDDMTSPEVTELGGEKIESVGVKGDKPITFSPKATKLTEEEFERALGNILLDGLFEIGGYGPTGNMIWTSGNKGTRYVVSEGFTEEGLAKLNKMLDIENPDDAVRKKAEITIEKLKVVLGEDATEALTTFSRFFALNQLQAEGIRNVKITGLMRDISPNELISRAFNLARGMVGPTYLAAELYLRLAGSHGIEVMNLALQNKEAGKLMVKMMETPANFTPKDAKDFVLILNEYVFTQLAMAGVKEINFGSDEQLQDLYYDIFQEENVFGEYESPLKGSIFEQLDERPTNNLLLKRNQINNSIDKIARGYEQRLLEESRRAEGARV
tara:strand:+ start:2035 stop:7545 length:5511 start_codon:yes stop_codon:yes gene_type:complete